MYYFQQSGPEILAPPVSLSPPNGDPTYDPEVPQLIITTPQSDPHGPVNVLILLKQFVNNELHNPYGTLLLQLIASSRVSHLVTNKIGR